MNATTIFIIVVLMWVAVGLLSMVGTRKNTTDQPHGQLKDEKDLAVKNMSGEEQAPTELDVRQNYVDTMTPLELSDSDNERYSTEWNAIQAKFDDAPGQAIMEADRLTMEVMKARGYPVTDFDQRAAEISKNYPDLVTNYRAAREISLRNEQQLAETDELSQAFIHYRSLLEDLLREKVIG